MSDRARINRPYESKQPDLEGVPTEEGVSEADAAERVEVSSEEQKNFTEKHGQRTQVNQPEPDGEPETGPDREESIALDAPEYDES
jgi:hypothetical protein